MDQEGTSQTREGAEGVMGDRGPDASGPGTLPVVQSDDPPARRYPPGYYDEVARKAGYCGSPYTQHSGPCMNKAGHGTHHLGEGFCKFHGGASVGGVTAGVRYASFAPKRLAEKIERLAQDKDLMDMTADVALVTGLIETELGQLKVEAGEMAEDWAAARALYDVAITMASEPEGLAAMTKLGQLLQGQAGRVTRWDRIDDMLGRRSQLVLAHGKLQRDANLMMSVAEAQVFVLRVASVLSEELAGIVPDDVMERIGLRIEAFMR